MAYVENSPRKQPPCHICHSECTSSCIFCDECSQWVHTSCDGIPDEKVRLFEDLPLDFPYICKNCRCDENRTLDYNKSFLRLQKAALQGFKKLQACVEREDLFLDGPFKESKRWELGSLKLDSNAQSLMESFLINDIGVPVTATSKDHVLFRTASLAISRKESLALELRVRCCVEMVKHESYYKRQYPLLARCAPDYKVSCTDCAKEDKWSSAWTISALANVIRRPIKSVYPNVNGPQDPAVQALNTSFKPYCSLEGESSTQEIRLLWSSDNEQVTVGSWKPNHFVLLIDQENSEPSPPIMITRKRPASEMDKSQNFDDIENCDNAREGDEVPESSSGEPDFERVPLERAMGGFPTESKKFMGGNEAFEKITKSNATEVQPYIPRGLKENIWFLVNNTKNMEHPEQHNTFVDDCGVWESKHSSVPQNFWLLDDKGIVCRLQRHKDVYKRQEKIGDKCQWVPLTPHAQPNPDKLAVCHRYYTRLKSSNQYRRCIIWFTLPQSWTVGKNVAVVQYLGKYPDHPSQKDKQSKRGRKDVHTDVHSDLMPLDITTNQFKKGISLSPKKQLKEMQKEMCFDFADHAQTGNYKYSSQKRENTELQKLRKKVEPKITTVSSGTEVIMEDVNFSLLGTEVRETFSPTSNKVIIQQGHSNEEDAGELAEGTELSHTNSMEVDEEQHAMDNDANINFDLNTQTKDSAVVSLVQVTLDRSQQAQTSNRPEFQQDFIASYTETMSQQLRLHGSSVNVEAEVSPDQVTQDHSQKAQTSNRLGTASPSVFLTDKSNLLTKEGNNIRVITRAEPPVASATERQDNAVNPKRGSPQDIFANHTESMQTSEGEDMVVNLKTKTFTPTQAMLPFHSELSHTKLAERGEDSQATMSDNANSDLDLIRLIAEEVLSIQETLEYSQQAQTPNGLGTTFPATSLTDIYNFLMEEDNNISSDRAANPMPSATERQDNAVNPTPGFIADRGNSQKLHLQGSSVEDWSENDMQTTEENPVFDLMKRIDSVYIEKAFALPCHPDFIASANQADSPTSVALDHEPVTEPVPDSGPHKLGPVSAPTQLAQAQVEFQEQELVHDFDQSEVAEDVTELLEKNEFFDEDVDKDLLQQFDQTSGWPPQK